MGNIYLQCSTTRTFLAFEAHQTRSGKACKTASQSDSLHVLMSANYEINWQNVDTSPIPSLLPAFNIACGKRKQGDTLQNLDGVYVVHGLYS